MSSRILAGRYELIEKVGEGGMAVVYKSRDRLLNRYVAVKILKPEFIRDLKFIESFRRESQAAASLSHPNIVNVYDVGKEGNIHYIVMEYIEGKVLSDLIKEEGALEPKRAVSIAKQIASALSLAHKNHIIHRDVKPHNILITEEGVAKITDFGIAKAISSATIVGKQTGTIMGSVHYFSPEQARGGYVDEKSDIYSLGIVLYEMLTGKVPFDGDNPVAVAVMHINDEMTPPSQLVPSIPPDVEAIVMKASSKYQVNRYKSADEMVTALSLANYHPAAEKQGKEAEGMGVRPTEAKADHAEEEGDKDEMGKKKKKVRINKVKLGAILLALLCAIPLSGLIYAGIGSLTAPKEVKVPNLEGKTKEEAAAELEPLKLNLEEDIMVSSEEFAEGQIVSQSPAADTTVKEGKTITVNISKGKKESKRIPNLIGGLADDAKFKLEQYGYILGGTKEEASDQPKGIVLKQSPDPGLAAKEGTAVSITVSSGVDNTEFSMINLMGLDLAKAKAELEKNGLKMGDPVYEFNDAYAKNQVSNQSVKAGTMVARGTAISLTVSKGPTGQINTVPIEISYSKAKNEVFSLSVIVSHDGGVDTPISNETRYKSEESEILSISGQGKGTVQVLFDGEMARQYTVNFDTGEVQ